MSDLILPASCRPHRRPVQISDLRVLVLVHKDTNRILCFAMDDKPTRRLAQRVGLKVIEIFHAHEYDKYAKAWREQAALENEKSDWEYLERENAKRQALRQQLRNRLAHADGPERRAIESAIHCLEQMEQRKQRYRAESFMAQEGFEQSKSDVGETLVNQIMAPRK